MSNHKTTQVLATNTLWNALERFSTMGIQLLCTFVLARFLTPADFGLVGMIVVFTLIGNTITESGFSQALIREGQVEQKTLSTVLWANIALSAVVYLVLYLVVPVIGRFYHTPLLVDVSRVTFLVIPLNALCLIHYTICTRELQFRRMCIISLVASTLSCTVAIAWAWHTRSVWALVVQNVLAYALRAAGFWISTRWRPSLVFVVSELRRLFAFSRNLLVTGLIGNLFNNIYLLVIGRLYGATQAGYFAQAERIRMVAATSSTQVIQNVSYPILSRINNMAEADLKTPYRRIILVCLLIVGFVMTLLMNISQDLMQLLMGSAEWRISGRYLYAIGIAGMLYPLHAVNQNILLVKKQGKTILWLEVARRTLMVIILLLASRYRVELFVWSYALYSLLLIFVNCWVCGRPIGYSLREQLSDIAPILTAFATLLVVGLCCNHVFAMQHIAVRISVTLITSILLGLLLLRRNSSFAECVTIARSLLHKSAS